MGRHEEAIAEIERAQESDPLSPVLPMVEGWTFLVARDYERAIAQLRKAIDMDPNFPRAHWYLGHVYVQKGMRQEALTELQKAITLEPEDLQYLAALGHACGKGGQRGEALKILDELKELSKRAYVPAYAMAEIYTGLGKKEEAFAWLEKAYEERSVLLVRLKVDPMPNPLRSDPRFQALLRRMNFPR
jgi:tetratricopeptide (TPR) repeat protein